MAIHGNKGQSARIKALESFKSGAIRVLVATDIAARGIDVSGLAAVVNYELPNVPETYVHRIGRTGRAGRDGLAISFCDFDELAYLKDIEKLIRKTIPVVEANPWPMEVFEPREKPVRPPRPPKVPSTPKAPGTPKTPSAPKTPGVPRSPAPPKPHVELPRAAVAPPPPPEPPQPPPRRISSEPSRMGRLVAFADGRKRKNRPPKK